MQRFEMTWDHILETRHEDVGLAAGEVEKTGAALTHLRTVFAEDVMAFPVLLLGRLINRAPWTYRWIVWLSESLIRLEPAAGYESIVKRLTDRQQFREALSVIQAAERMQAAGLGVEFDVAATVGERRKVPDLLLNDPETGVALHCEVSVLFSPEKQVEASRALDFLGRLFFHQRDEPIAYAGLLRCPVSEHELEGIFHRIRWEMLEVRKDSSFHEVVLDGKLELALAPAAQANRVAEWARQRGLELNSFGVVPEPVDQASRLERKIEEKAEQLPAGLPNVLVLPAQNIFISIQDPVALLPLITEMLSRHPKVAMLVLSSEEFGSAGPQATTVGDHLFVTSRRDGLEHRHLVAFNASCRAALPANTLNKLHLAFSL